MKSLEKFSKKVIQDLTTGLHNYKSDSDTETLHQIRVSVKKIKAIIELVNYSRKKFNGHRAFIPFRTIFRKAGAVREPEVLQKLLTANPVENLFLKKKYGVTRPTKTFIKNIPFFIETTKRARKKLRPHLAKVSKKDFNRFFSEKLLEVESQLSPKPNMTIIHKTRKAIKIVVYLSKVKDNLPETAKIFYSKMEEAIGQWHDKQVWLANLKKQDSRTEIKRMMESCAKDETTMETLAAEYYQ